MTDDVKVRQWHVALVAMGLIWMIATSTFAAFGGYSTSVAVQAEQIKELRQELVTVQTKQDEQFAQMAVLQEQQERAIALLQQKGK